MLDEVLACLRCPLCAADLAIDGAALRCPAGHAFDIARQGYANLLTGGAHAGTADTADMVAARDAFLSGGHFGPLTELIARTAADHATGDGCVLDAGAGTGHYLSAALDSADRPGLALDISKYALRRAARAHPRIGAVVWDVWRPWPVRDGAASVLLDVFAPRNGAEFHRVLRPGGTLIVVTPAAGHLGELTGPLGLLSVDGRKAERVGESLGGRFVRTGTTALEMPLSLTRAQAVSLIAMGPNAWHTDPAARIAELTEPVEVTASVDVATYVSATTG